MSDQMPPLGPPYGPPGPPPPPRFPAHPPTEWGPRLIEPLPTPPPPPPRDNRGLLAVIGAIVAVAVLVAGAVAYASRDDGEPAATRPRRTTTTQPDTATDSTESTDATDSTDSSAPPPDLEKAIADIKRFVEQERGLKYKTDVPVELLDGKAFVDELLKGFEDQKAEVLETEEVLKSLGLVDRARDVTQDMRDLLSIGVLGFYDQKTKRLVVRGTEATPLVRQVIAHELTHALDDQWFNLDRPELDRADDESGFGFDALVEGSARVVENAYHDKELSSAEQREADLAELDVTTSSPQLFTLPVVLLALLNAPYDAGRGLVARLVEDGQTRLDDAFAQPPSTSEQVIEPDKYVDAEGAVPVAEPETANGLPVSNRGVLGVLLLEQLLEDGFGIDVTSIDRALEGWGGDRYVTWVDGDRTCIRDVVVGDDARATSTLLQRFQDWAGSAGINATVAPVSTEAGAPFAITSCSL